MSKPANTIKNVNREEKHGSRGKKAGRTIGRQLHNLLDGSFLNRDSVFAWMPFIFFIALIGIVYIGNNHFAERKIREINRLNTEIKELGFDYLNMKSRVNEKTRASFLARELEKHGIKPLVEPPEKIFIKK
ncbi:MAG: FtsL-like putative cell division protein [Bacteroidales bacterium]